MNDHIQSLWIPNVRRQYQCFDAMFMNDCIQRIKVAEDRQRLYGFLFQSGFDMLDQLVAEFFFFFVDLLRKLQLVFARTDYQRIVSPIPSCSLFGRFDGDRFSSLLYQWCLYS